MITNYLEVFDSKNTSTKKIIITSSWHEVISQAIMEARAAHKVIAYRTKNGTTTWNEYKRDERGRVEGIAWSYPNGITN